jgi:TonB family protein
MTLAALVALAMQPAPDLRIVNPQVPRGDLLRPAQGNLSRYFSNDDYPVSARFNEEEGTVGVVVFVNADGRVEGCYVAGSSNSSSLDEESCRIIRRRARFTPAAHSSGRPVADFVAARIRWETGSGLPASGSPEAAGQSVGPFDVVIRGAPIRRQTYPVIRARPLRPLSSLVTYRDYPSSAPRGTDLRSTSFRLTIGPDGNVEDCTVNASSGSAELDGTACRLMRERARFSPARVRAGNAISDEHWGRIDWGSRECSPVVPPPLPRQR